MSVIVGKYKSIHTRVYVHKSLTLYNLQMCGKSWNSKIISFSKICQHFIIKDKVYALWIISSKLFQPQCHFFKKFVSCPDFKPRLVVLSIESAPLTWYLDTVHVHIYYISCDIRVVFCRFRLFYKRCFNIEIIFFDIIKDKYRYSYLGNLWLKFVILLNTQN